VSQRIFVISPAADRELGELKQRYHVSAGDRIDDTALSEADRDMTDLLRQNGFRQANVRHALRHEGGRTNLYVYLNPGPRIVPMFEGNHAFDKDQLGQALAVDDGHDTRPEELAQRLKKFYIDRGFLDIEITTNTTGRQGDPVHYLVFAIREGNQVRVTKRVFPCLPPDVFPPEKIGAEIESFLQEELPGPGFFSIGNPRVIDTTFGPNERTGARPQPLVLNPAMTYAPETYERALRHLRDLFHSKGYLNAVVGPVSIVRPACSRRSRPGQCIPEPLRESITAQCLKDTAGLPLPEPSVPASLTCKADRRHLIECSPEVTLRIPIHLGDETVLYDIAFEGNRSLTEQELAGMVELKLGDPLSTVALESARQKVIEEYRNRGYAYADVRTVVEPSPDRTRARAKLVITERDLVIVDSFTVRGATRTSKNLILERMALKKGEPFKQDLARKSEDLISSLGTFASVSVALKDPEVPQKQKEVVITVSEQLPQYIDPRVGFSTGEGLRFAFEYGHRNIGGLAIALTLRVQFNYLFEFMIPEGSVRERYDLLSVGNRLERRNTAALVFQEFGLGPLWRLSFEAIDVRDNQRDYGITRWAFIPTLSYRPFRSVNAQLGTSLERNDVTIFNAAAANSTVSLLRAPQGTTNAVAERLNITFDARDNPFAATRGILIGGGVEHVNAFPEEDDPEAITSHFFRFSGRVAGYVPIADKMSLALSLSAGYNLQLTSESQTYPDRLFFLGGTDSLRGFLADSVVPEDVAQAVLSNNEKKRISIDEVAIRGGNFVLNPRAELRIPLTETFQIGLFLDTGNIWVNPAEIDLFTLRYALGAGLRINTPIGPLVLDYGINLIKREWPSSGGAGTNVPPGSENEDRGNFHFSIGLF
jgi:outer membrane protein assembly factor BamA